MNTMILGWYRVKCRGARNIYIKYYEDFTIGVKRGLINPSFEVRFSKHWFGKTLGEVVLDFARAERRKYAS